MPPKAPKAVHLTSDLTDGESASAEFTSLLERMRRTANDRRRKKREQIEAGYSQELAGLEAEKMHELEQRFKVDKRRRAEFIHRFKVAAERKREIERQIARVLHEVEAHTSEILADSRAAEKGTASASQL